METSTSNPPILRLSCPEWKDHFLGSMHQLWKENLMCDTQIKCLNDNTVNAHSIILASCSPFLKKFFMRCRPGLYTLKMNTTSVYLWTLLLQFLYTGHLELPQSQLMPFYNLVVKLKVKQAETLCLAYIQGQLGVATTTAITTSTTTAAVTTTATTTVTAQSSATLASYYAPPRDVKKEILEPEERMDTYSGRILGSLSICRTSTPPTNTARFASSIRAAGFTVPPFVEVKQKTVAAGMDYGPARARGPVPFPPASIPPSYTRYKYSPESGICAVVPEQEQAAQPEEGTGDWMRQIKLHSVRSLCPGEGGSDSSEEEDNTPGTRQDRRSPTMSATGSATASATGSAVSASGSAVSASGSGTVSASGSVTAAIKHKQKSAPTRRIMKRCKQCNVFVKPPDFEHHVCTS